MGFFTKLSTLYSPPPHIEQLPHEVVDSEYKRHRRMVFSVFSWVTAQVI